MLSLGAMSLLQLPAPALIFPGSVNRSPATLRTAETTLRIRMQCLFVIDRNFITGPNIAQGKEQHVAVKRPHVCVRLATMVDVVSAVAAATAVYAEPSVDVADAQEAALARALLRFQIVDSLTGVFSNLPAAFERDGGKAAFAVDVRFANGEAVSKFHVLALYEDSPQRSQRRQTEKTKRDVGASLFVKRHSVRFLLIVLLCVLCGLCARRQLLICGDTYRTNFSSASAANFSTGNRPMTIFAVFGSRTTSKPSSFSFAIVSSDFSVRKI